MDFIIQATKQNRTNCIALAKNLTEDELHFIPAGYANNLIWHLGHIMVSQQILCYSLSNTPLIIPENYLSLYRKGTSPVNWTEKPDFKELIQWMNVTSEALKEDYKSKKFGTFNEYTTSAGVVLKRIEDAIAYNYGHENLHYGNMISMLKLLK